MVGTSQTNVNTNTSFETLKVSSQQNRTLNQSSNSTSTNSKMPPALVELPPVPKQYANPLSSAMRLRLKRTCPPDGPGFGYGMRIADRGKAPVLQILLNLNAMNAMEPQRTQSSDLSELCVLCE